MSETYDKIITELALEQGPHITNMDRALPNSILIQKLCFEIDRLYEINTDLRMRVDELKQRCLGGGIWDIDK